MVKLTFSYVLRPSGNTSFYAISKINSYLVTVDKKNVSCKELMRRHVLCVWVMLSICQYLTWTYWIIRLSGVCLTAGEKPPLTGGPHQTPPHYSNIGGLCLGCRQRKENTYNLYNNNNNNNKRYQHLSKFLAMH